MMRAWGVVLVACSTHATPPAPDHALHVDVTTAGDEMHARVVGHDVDMAHVPTVSWIGVPMTGSADLAIEITVPVKDGESDYRAATGILSVTCATCSMGFDVERLARQLGRGVAMPRLPLEKLDVQAAIGNGRVEIAKWTASLGGTDVAIDGHITLAKRPSQSWLAVCVRIPALRARDLPPMFGSFVGFDGSGQANIKLTGELDEARALGVACDTDAGAATDPIAPAPTGDLSALALAPPPDPAPAPDPDVAAKITKTGDHAYTIDRALVDRVLANPMAVTKGARVVPALRDGKAIGFRLYGIRPGTFFAALGIENGDTITAVNGEELVSADKALEIYTKLHDATALRLGLERRGQSLVLDYTIK